MRTWHAIVLVLLLTALPSCERLDSGPSVQRALDIYAPDLTLGARVGSAARRRYHLEVAPYTGYRDSAYRAPDGLRDLRIKVNEYVDDGDRRVSPMARITMVSLPSPDSVTSRRVEARLRAMLGAPREECYSYLAAGPWRRLYWTGERGRGVLLVTVLPRTFNPPASRANAQAGESYDGPIGSGTVVFGAETPDRGVQFFPCP